MVERKQSDENQEDRGAELTYDASCIWCFYLGWHHFFFKYRDTYRLLVLKLMIPSGYVKIAIENHHF